MSKSTDRYLYAISALKQKYLCVRAVDLAHYLGVSKASVSTMLRDLRGHGLVCVEPDGNLTLSPSGEKRVGALDARVRFFRELLEDAGVEPAQALLDAISFSWEMSEASFEAFRALKQSQTIRNTPYSHSKKDKAESKTCPSEFASCQIGGVGL